jgi:16S rRNA (cytosine1402-N4)-methyltransferase
MELSSGAGHVSVLYQPVLFWLQPAPGLRIVDGTLGGAGHTEGLLAAGADVLALDRDASAVERASTRLARFAGRAILRQASYRQAPEILRQLGWNTVDGILLDLGFSSLQMDDPQRGFSFRLDGPLDMRFDRAGGSTAADLINTLPEQELARLIAEYGEDRNARRIASAIVRARPFETTRALADVIAHASGARRDRAGSIHPATRTFQALRIAVNGELEELATALPLLVDALKPEGRLAIISFHSLEDRLVKQFFRKASGTTPRFQPAGLRVGPEREEPAVLRELTRRPVIPDQEEIQGNPRARSAKLRVAEKLPLKNEIQKP